MKKRISVLTAVVFACLLAPPIPAQTGVNGEGTEEARKLNSRAVALYKEGKYEEAIKLQKQALAL